VTDGKDKFIEINRATEHLPIAINRATEHLFIKINKVFYKYKICRRQYKL